MPEGFDQGRGFLDNIDGSVTVDVIYSHNHHLEIGDRPSGRKKELTGGTDLEIEIYEEHEPVNPPLWVENVTTACPLAVLAMRKPHGSLNATCLFQSS
ncbi:hypothetical protein L7E84_003529 [Salmonella enterica]|nr:hypothetical protein [Salmonella enterica]